MFGACYERGQPMQVVRAHNRCDLAVYVDVKRVAHVLVAPVLSLLV